MPTEVDLENRDPNGINTHIGVTMEDILAEPEGAHSADCLWKNAYMCYTGGLSCCYKCLTFLCGLCAALCWGWTYATLAFCHIWCITPACKCYDLHCQMLKNLIASILDAVLGQCCATCGMCLSRIEVSNK